MTLPILLALGQAKDFVLALALLAGLLQRRDPRGLAWPLLQAAATLSLVQLIGAVAAGRPATAVAMAGAPLVGLAIAWLTARVGAGWSAALGSAVGLGLVAWIFLGNFGFDAAVDAARLPDLTIQAGRLILVGLALLAAGFAEVRRPNASVTPGRARSRRAPTRS